jgi:hypothetical protein
MCISLVQIRRGVLQLASCGVTEMLSAAIPRDGKAMIVMIINASDWIVIWRFSVLIHGAIPEFFMTTLNI